MAGERVKCKFCGEYFNATKEPSVYIEKSKRYAHKICYDKNSDTDDKESSAKKILKKNLRKCVYCKKEFDITDGYRMPRQNSYAHIHCYEKNYSPDEKFIIKIYSYLKSIGINYDYAQCERQRSYFISKLGYTNEGVYKSLKYFYGIKKGSPERSGNRIGIVSYVYNEAMDYYGNLEKKQKEIEKKLTSQLKNNNQDKKEKLNRPTLKNKKQFINLDEIGVGE